MPRYGNWTGMRRALTSLGGNITTACESQALKEAVFLVSEMQKGIADQAPGGKALKGISEVTKRFREIDGFRGTNALMRTGEMRKAYTHKKVAMATYFVGLLATAVARSAKGGTQYLANIAAVHEFGPTTITVTRKMRLFFGYKYGFWLKASTKAIVIPARQVITPVWQKEGPGCMQRIAGAVAAGAFKGIV